MIVDGDDDLEMETTSEAACRKQNSTELEGRMEGLEIADRVLK